MLWKLQSSRHGHGSLSTVVKDENLWCHTQAVSLREVTQEHARIETATGPPGYGAEDEKNDVARFHRLELSGEREVVESGGVLLVEAPGH